VKILFTGFTSRAVGSDRNVYDYMCNVNVLAEALRQAGHEVDHRYVSLVTDPCPEEDYDVALVGVAAVNGLSSRFKLGALHVLSRFGSRAGIFPSDGKNVAIFPASVQSVSRLGEHACGPFPSYLLGEGMGDRNNVIEHDALRAQGASGEAWLNSVLDKLPQTSRLKCAYPALFPLHAWGKADVYGRAWGAAASGWDPTNVAIPMQFGTGFDAHFDGRYQWARYTDRKRQWVLASLQDNSAWLKKVKPTWPVISVGNKRAAKAGTGVEYVPEDVIIHDYYGKSWGTLSFGYPLGHGGWWRMRYIHAALAGCVTCCDPNDAIPMPDSFKHSRIMLERWSDEKLAEVALQQHEDIKSTSWTVDRTVQAVNQFVVALKG
jgi:hypothetical protein